MLASRSIRDVCLPCRLKLLGSANRANLPVLISSRVKASGVLQSRRSLRRFYGSSSYWRQENDTGLGPDHGSPKRWDAHRVPNLDASSGDAIESAALANSYAEIGAVPDSLSPIGQQLNDPETVARRARQDFGDRLPASLLSQEEYMVYERLYGKPLGFPGPEGDSARGREGKMEEGDPYSLWRETPEGNIEQVAMRPSDRPSPLDVALHLEGEALEEDMEHYEDIDSTTAAGSPEDAATSEAFVRHHPFTVAGKFATTPSTLHLPRHSFVEPITHLLSGSSNRQLAEVADRVFGGRSLPLSVRTLPARANAPQKPVALEAAQSQMGSMEGDAYMAVMMPGAYAAVMAALVEVRRRLGSTWLEKLLQKPGGPLVMDAGAGGAAVVAWREVLRAEWERLQEDKGMTSRTPAPTGRATVLTGSATLRQRVSRFLDNTTFLPRLPDTVFPGEIVGPEPRKLYDIIIAPHTLWQLKEEYVRKQHVQKLWSLLNPDGGVLVLLEKGLPRGFEAIAGARDLLLSRHIASPGYNSIGDESQEPELSGDSIFIEKEPGMIIAPCTNHVGCPMYTRKGVSPGRKDFCYFSQRYIRPPFLQRILGAKHRNHEDIQFSYLAVMRGRDLRRKEYDHVNGTGVLQGEDAVQAAFKGYEDYPVHNALDFENNRATEAAMEAEAPAGPETTPDKTPKALDSGSDPTDLPFHTLSLPRLILPALKRHGHVIMDVCTPAGALERWTVPRSYSKQAYKDARKAQWGDLWALGAKTRISRNLRLGREGEKEGGWRKPGKVGREKDGRVGRAKVKEDQELLEEILGLGKAAGTSVEVIEDMGRKSSKGASESRTKERSKGGRRKRREILDDF